MFSDCFDVKLYCDCYFQIFLSKKTALRCDVISSSVANKNQIQQIPCLDPECVVRKKMALFLIVTLKDYCGTQSCL